MVAATSDSAGTPDLPDGVVEVYTAQLSSHSEADAPYRALLSPDELVRADRFLDRQHQVRYAVGRGILRVVLGKRLDVPPESIEFVYGEKGKPALRDRRLEFNASHSREIVMIALTRKQGIGVDVEHQRVDLDHMKLAERFFSKSERDDIRALPESQRQDAFYACWTRKEAYMKAVGDGFSIPLSGFRVSVSPREVASLLEVAGNAGEVDRWRLSDVPAPDGYYASIAVEAPLREVRTFSV